MEKITSKKYRELLTSNKLIKYGNLRRRDWYMEELEPYLLKNKNIYNDFRLENKPIKIVNELKTQALDEKDCIYTFNNLDCYMLDDIVIVNYIKTNYTTIFLIK